MAAITPANYDVKVGNGLGAKTLIVSVNKGTGNHTQAELDELIQKLGNATGTGGTVGVGDAFTVAGVAGTVGTDPLYLALQGTGTLGTTAGDYVADITLAVVATFESAT